MTTISGLCLLGPGNPAPTSRLSIKVEESSSTIGRGEASAKISSSDSSGETLMLPAITARGS